MEDIKCFILISDVLGMRHLIDIMCITKVFNVDDDYVCVQYVREGEEDDFRTVLVLVDEFDRVLRGIIDD